MNLANLSLQENDLPLVKAWLLGPGNSKEHIVYRAWVIGCLVEMPRRKS
jgi:hypothetical protein